MKINNCPFCGSDSVYCEGSEEVVTGHYYIVCNECDAAGEEKALETEAIQAWNKPGDRIESRKITIDNMAKQIDKLTRICSDQFKVITEKNDKIKELQEDYDSIFERFECDM